jgi:hypothetical protein
MLPKMIANSLECVEAAGLQNIDQVSPGQDYYRMTVLANFAICLGV